MICARRLNLSGAFDSGGSLRAQGGTSQFKTAVGKLVSAQPAGISHPASAGFCFEGMGMKRAFWRQALRFADFIRRAGGAI